MAKTLESLTDIRPHWQQKRNGDISNTGSRRRRPDRKRACTTRRHSVHQNI